MRQLINIFSIPELRRKILLTLLFLLIYRVGFSVPLPIVDQNQLAEWAKNLSETAGGKIFGYISLFSGTDIGQSTIFGLGIMPYISASIIFQLLTNVIPTLEKLSKEGESGRKKINEYTRYATVVICLGQSAMWVRFLFGSQNGIVVEEYQTFYFGFLSVLTMTAGTIFLMWLGEQIDEYGIGNGISLIIMAGIIARMPEALNYLVTNATFDVTQGGEKIGIGKIIIMALLFVSIVVGVILVTQGQRRIPIQQAKHVRGHRVYGGQRQYLPLKVNQAGVMPVIFASSLLMFPYFIFRMLNQQFGVGEGWYVNMLAELEGIFNGHTYMYHLCYIGMVYFFCYFWTAITFNPKDIADNLKNHGSFIPGYRPGKRTTEYLEKVMLRITYVGAAFLSLVAIIPSIISSALGIDYVIAGFYGGTGLLIVISVALDIVQKIESHLIMRHYDSLLKPSGA